MSYKNLETYKLALELYFEVHELTQKFPSYETYELGSQLRRSADSVVSNLVEGYGRSTYKSEFIKHLIYSHASNDETIVHLEKIKRLYPKFQIQVSTLLTKYEKLGTMIYQFRNYVHRNWKNKEN
jgi:four helix bundle protein